MNMHKIVEELFYWLKIVKNKGWKFNLINED